MDIANYEQKWYGSQTIENTPAICKTCAANYIVNPPRWTVIAADRPVYKRMADSNSWTGPMTRQFFRDLAAAKAFYAREVDLLDVGCVQLWDREVKIKEVYE